MWRSPKCPAPPPPQPPIDTGHRLAKFPKFPRGNGAELRINLAAFEGRPDVALRVGEPGTDLEVQVFLQSDVFRRLPWTVE
jgi:hypothetical protein